jgi:hypothetical protein
MKNTIANRGKHILDLRLYNNKNVPECVGDTLQLLPTVHDQYVLCMLIRDGAIGTPFVIPEEIEWIMPMLLIADRYQSDVIKIRHSFVYVTIRHGVVKSVNDNEWHVDGFSTAITHVPEQNYIWCDRYPTEYLVNPVAVPKSFNPDIHNLQLYIQDKAHNGIIQTTVNKHVFCIDPYVIHRRPKIPAGTRRTFVRISYVPIAIRDKNNTTNRLLSTMTYSEDGVAKRDSLLRYR